MSASWLNAPNVLTLSRVVLGFACLAPLTAMTREGFLIALAIMVVAELTDLFDGMVARATNSVTDSGKILDPMADSIYRLTIFSAFVQNDWMPAWLLCVFILRDVSVAYVRIGAVQKGTTPASRMSGKIKAVAQGGAQVLAVAVFAFALDNLTPFVPALLYAAAAVTLYSLVDYAFGMLKSTPSAGKADQSK